MVRPAPMSEPRPDYLDALGAHLEANLGPSTGFARIDTAAGTIELRKYEPVPGSLVLGSLGVGPMGPLRREAVISLPGDPPEDVLAAACSALGDFAEKCAKHPIRAGDAFIPPPEVLEGLPVDAVLVLPPVAFTESLGACTLPDGPVELVWLVPGYRAEADYLRQHGPNVLLHLLRAQRLDPAFLDRPAASTFLAPEDALRMGGAAEGGERSYRVEQSRGAVKVERRKKPIGREPPRAQPRREPPPSAEVRGQSPEPAPPARARPRPAARPRPEPAGRFKDVKRFDLGAAAKAAPEAPPPPKPKKPERRLSPEEAKKARIAALREKAKEARSRYAARLEGTAEPTVVAPAAKNGPAPRESRAVRAASRRRGRRPGASGPAGS